MFLVYVLINFLAIIAMTRGRLEALFRTMSEGYYDAILHHIVNKKTPFILSMSGSYFNNRPAGTLFLLFV